MRSKLSFVLVVLLFFAEIDLAAGGATPASIQVYFSPKGGCTEAVVDECRDAVVLREGRCGVFVGLVALVQNHLNLHAATMCVRESLGDWRGREGVGLNEHRRFGFGQRIDDRLGAPPFGEK